MARITTPVAHYVSHWLKDSANQVNSSLITMHTMHAVYAPDSHGSRMDQVSYTMNLLDLIRLFQHTVGGMTRLDAAINGKMNPHKRAIPDFVVTFSLTHFVASRYQPPPPHLPLCKGEEGRG